MMACPLPAPRNVNATGAANQGLRYAKFFAAWPIGQQEFKLDSDAKLNWVNAFAGARCGERGQLHDAAGRRAALVEKLGGHTEPMVLTSPFVTGLGLDHPIDNGFLWHQTLGVPYLPGSGVKGLIRAWAEHWLNDRAHLERLFGRDARHERGPAAGNLIVFDAIPSAPVQLMAEVMTPHDGGWRVPGSATTAPSDWLSPKPIPFLAVAPDTNGDYPFQFAFAPRGGAETGEVEQALHYLKDALDWLGAGAKTAVGFGRFVDENKLEDEVLNAWRVGDRAEFFRQPVEIVELDLAEKKVRLMNTQSGNNLKGMRDLTKLKRRKKP